jgi:hypothetical protein
VMHGMSAATAAVRISYPSVRVPECPYGVLITSWILPARISSTMFAAPPAYEDDW